MSSQTKTVSRPSSKTLSTATLLTLTSFVGRHKSSFIWLDKPFHRVLSVLPDLYDDLWTGAKGM